MRPKLSRIVEQGCLSGVIFPPFLQTWTEMRERERACERARESDRERQRDRARASERASERERERSLCRNCTSQTLTCVCACVCVCARASPLSQTLTVQFVLVQLDMHFNFPRRGILHSASGVIY
jgi:hypothetical protein